MPDLPYPTTPFPAHPGRAVLHDLIGSSGLTAGRVAKACDVPRTRIERILSGEVGITADTAIRLGRLFGTGPRFWMDLQQRHELERAAAALDATADAIVPLSPHPEAA